MHFWTNFVMRSHALQEGSNLNKKSELLKPQINDFQQIVSFNAKNAKRFFTLLEKSRLI